MKNVTLGVVTALGAMSMREALDKIDAELLIAETPKERRYKPYIYHTESRQAESRQVRRARERREKKQNRI